MSSFACRGRVALHVFLLECYSCFTTYLRLCCQVVFVAATKVDLPGRKVPEAEGRAWALAHNMPYFEVGWPAKRSVGTLQGMDDSACFSC
jgi:hypothetical protein